MQSYLIVHKNFLDLYLNRIPTTIYFTNWPHILLCVKIPPIFFPLYTISFGALIWSSILFCFFKTSTIIFAISTVSPCIFWTSQSVFIKIEKAILFSLSVYHCRPCVPHTFFLNFCYNQFSIFYCFILNFSKNF